jgi:hypothetical protein
VATLGREPRESSNPDIGDKYQMIPLERKLVTRRDLLVAELVHILEENKRNERIPKVIISKNLRRPNHPLLTVRSRRERKWRPGFLD